MRIDHNAMVISLDLNLHGAQAPNRSKALPRAQEPLVCAIGICTELHCTDTSAIQCRRDIQLTPNTTNLCAQIGFEEPDVARRGANIRYPSARRDQRELKSRKLICEGEKA